MLSAVDGPSAIGHSERQHADCVIDLARLAQIVPQARCVKFFLDGTARPMCRIWARASGTLAQAVADRTTREGQPSTLPYGARKRKEQAPFQRSVRKDRLRPQVEAPWPVFSAFQPFRGPEMLVSRLRDASDCTFFRLANSAAPPSARSHRRENRQWPPCLANERPFKSRLLKDWPILPSFLPAAVLGRRLILQWPAAGCGH